MRIICTVLIVVLFVFAVHSRENQNLTLIGRAADGHCKNVAVKDQLVLFDNGAYFQIADFSDPENPQILSKTLTHGVIKDIVVYQQHAYVANSSGTTFIYNISDPANPVLETEMVWVLNQMTISDHNLYVTGYSGGQGMGIFDLSNPTHPMEKSWNSTSKSVYHLTTAGENVYAAAYSDSIFLFDATNLEAPEHVQTIVVKDRIKRVLALDTLLYVLDGEGLKVFDMTDPNEPQLLGQYNRSGLLYDLVVKNDTLYASSFHGGVNAVDINDLTNPTWIDEFDTHGHSWDIAEMDGLFLFADQEEGLKCLDWQDLGNPMLKSHIITNSSSYRMVKKDGYLFVGCSSGIFNVYDISIPGSPQRVFSDYLGGSDIYDISRQGNLVYLACRNMGMQIIDITNPLEPVLVGDFVNRPYSFETMAIRNNWVYLASTKGMIYILDTTQPDAIVKKDSIDIGRDIKSVALLNDYLYVANDDSFLHVINVADDNAPVIETQIPVQNRPIDLVVFESFLYLWTGGDLNVYDVSIPHAPELVTTTLQSSGRSLFFDYPYLYLTTYSRGLWMLDVTDPMNIERVGVYDTYGAPWDGYAEGDYVYLADQRDGIYIFQNDRKVAGVTGERQSIPKEFTLEQPYPNPFNSSIKIDFVLKRTERIRLTVYNNLGQVVRTLVDRQLSPGKHTVHWQGLDDANTNVASGVYVVRMELKDEQVMKKILLLR